MIKSSRREFIRTSALVAASGIVLAAIPDVSGDSLTSSENDFIEIHSPKLMSSPSESNAELFKLITQDAGAKVDADIVLILVQDGVVNGAIYALLALSLVLVFAVTRVILIPQGEFITYGALTYAYRKQGAGYVLTLGEGATPPGGYVLQWPAGEGRPERVRIDGLAVPEKNLSETDFCQWLTREIGVAAIPLSAFYADGFDQRVIRFCFAKKDETLKLALERLTKL